MGRKSNPPGFFKPDGIYKKQGPRGPPLLYTMPPTEKSEISFSIYII